MKTIRQAGRLDQEQINDLRITEFQRSSEFTLLRPEKLLWNKCDDDSIVLAAWDGPRAVSTMRAVLIYNRPDAEDCVECTVSEDTDFPAMVFNSAATRLEYRGLGLNQLLRYHFLKIAVENGIQSLLSPMYDGAPRIKFMKELGYTFTTPLSSWQNKLKPQNERILGVLKRKMMPNAIDIIKKQRSDIIRKYPWEKEPVKLCQSVLEVLD